jgi:hypothetical protein
MPSQIITGVDELTSDRPQHCLAGPKGLDLRPMTELATTQILTDWIDLERISVRPDPLCLLVLAQGAASPAISMSP